MSQPTQKLLNPDALSKAQALGLKARLIVEGVMTGNHRSPMHGFSSEFKQHREYTAGDDLRHLDWKIVARSDKYVVKQFEQETNFVCHLLLDVSESMVYGKAGNTKLEYAQSLMACLAYAILKKRDWISLNLFDQSMRSRVPPTGSLASMQDVLTTLTLAEPRGETALAPMLQEIAQRHRRRGIIIIASDLLDDEERFLASLRMARVAGHEIVVFHVLDDDELNFPFKGATIFDGIEIDQQLTTRPNQIRKSYMENLTKWQHLLRDGCVQQGCHYTLMNTKTPLGQGLSEYLAFRRGASSR